MVLLSRIALACTMFLALAALVPGARSAVYTTDCPDGVGTVVNAPPATVPACPFAFLEYRDCAPGGLGSDVLGIGPCPGLCPAGSIGVTTGVGSVCALPCGDDALLGAQVDGHAACLDPSPCAGSPDVQTVCAFLGLGACPDGYAGVEAMGGHEQACEWVPGTQACSPGELGLATDWTGTATCIGPALAPCPSGQVGIDDGMGQDLCQPIPQPSACDVGDVGLVLGGAPVCVTPPAVAACDGGRVGLQVGPNQVCL